jgi:aryl-alcohol dehydrogenase-like predicted oxidoreductase
MAAFNAAGFWVNPSLPACEAAVREPGMTFVAMSTLAAGHLTPEAAYSYLGQFPSVAAVVVGMSNPRHAAETVNAIRRHMPFLFSSQGPAGEGTQPAAVP